jgi:hypothetical protein
MPRHVLRLDAASLKLIVKIGPLPDAQPDALPEAPRDALDPGIHGV